MKIPTKNVLLMFYFKFQLEIFWSSIHDYHKSLLVSLFLPGTNYNKLLRIQCVSSTILVFSGYNESPPQSLASRILVPIILLIRAWIIHVFSITSSLFHTHHLTQLLNFVNFAHACTNSHSRTQHNPSVVILLPAIFLVEKLYIYISI